VNSADVSEQKNDMLNDILLGVYHESESEMDIGSGAPGAGPAFSPRFI
jgi:hypothetical protein